MPRVDKIERTAEAQLATQSLMWLHNKARGKIHTLKIEYAVPRVLPCSW
jgi:hypothetical protein